MEKKNLKDKIFVIVSLIAYMVITFIITIHHENWRDEAQSFLIAKNLSFFDIFKQLKYEGHPFVFYYIVKLFTLLGFEYRIVNIISWISMSIAAYLILSKSSFKKPTKILILLTVPFIYQYVAFGRSYCLATLLTMLLAYMYDKKEKHPYIYAVLIALLMNTHMFMLGFALMLVITFYIYELILNRKELESKQKKKYLISLVIIAVAIVLLVLQFSSTLTSNSYATIEKEKLDIKIMVEQALKQVIYYYSYAITNNESVTVITTIITFVTIGISLANKTIKEVLILIGAIGYQVLFVALLGQSKIYILMTGFVIYIFYLWIILNKLANISNNKIYKTIVETLFIMTCLISIIFGSIASTAG